MPLALGPFPHFVGDRQEPLRPSAAEGFSLRPMRLILASSSPRRRDILDGFDLAFDIVTPDVEEIMEHGESAGAFVERMAVAKASSAATHDHVVLAADTVVVLDGEVLGKPVDSHHAQAMLARIAGRTHDVLTGVAVVLDDQHVSTVVRSTVTMAPMSERDIAWYVGTGEPLDKAGSYALQGIGMAFVEGVHGSVTNVIGLPAAETRRLFAALGLDLLSFT